MEDRVDSAGDRVVDLVEDVVDEAGAAVADLEASIRRSRMERFSIKGERSIERCAIFYS